MPRKPQEPTKKEPGVYPRRLKDGTLVFDLMIMAKGKQQMVRGFRGTHREAVQERDRLRQEKRDGSRGTAPARLTLGDFILKRWHPAYMIHLESRSKTGEVKPNTRASIETRMRRIVRMIGDRRLADLDGDDVQDFIEALHAEKLSPTYRALNFALLAMVLKDAVRRKLITANPCDQVEAPRASKARTPRLTLPQIRRIIEAADTENDGVYGAYVYVTLMTGMREVELLNLRWEEIDWRTGRLDLDESKSVAGERGIILGEDTLERLRRHRREQLKRLYDVAPNASEPPLVFLTARFKKINQSSYHMYWRKIAAAAGLPTLHHHDLRHVHSTLLARAGTHPSVMQQRMGHADPRTTLGIYTHANVEDQRPAAAAVEALIRGEGS